MSLSTLRGHFEKRARENVGDSTTRTVGTRGMIVSMIMSRVIVEKKFSDDLASQT